MSRIIIPIDFSKLKKIEIAEISVIRTLPRISGNFYIVSWRFTWIWGFLIFWFTEVNTFVFALLCNSTAKFGRINSWFRWQGIMSLYFIVNMCFCLVALKSTCGVGCLLLLSE